MKIAVVDDSDNDLKMETDYIASYIMDNYQQLSSKLKITGFQNPREFVATFEAEKFDLVVLDIIMDNMNGIQVAEFIRTKDKNCNIIFVTNSEEFLIDGYSVFAVGYFLKPINEHQNEFEKTFEYICSKLGNVKELPIKVIRNVNVQVPYSDIYFVDINENHKVRITTSEQEFITTMTYKECSEILLKDRRFLECHYRIIVNMDYVQSMKSEDFILKNGTAIPISQRRKRESKLQYMNYIVHKNF